MSYSLIPQVFAITGLPPIAKLVLLALADAADNRHGRCWPSYRRIMERTGLASRDAVSHALRLLEDRRLITVERKHRRSNRYTVNLSPADGPRGRPADGLVASGSRTQAVRQTDANLSGNRSENRSEASNNAKNTERTHSKRQDAIVDERLRQVLTSIGSPQPDALRAEDEQSRAQREADRREFLRQQARQLLKFEGGVKAEGSV